LPIAWHCTKCGYTYKVVSDTLIYKIADKKYKDSFNEKCPKCSMGFVRLYRHVNPKYGKQYWASVGWYCTRCRYIWMDEETTE
jgi:ribosomal protein S27AE